MKWIVLAGSFVALAIAGSSIAKANTITTFNVEQPALLVFPSPGGQMNITGTLTIDVTAGIVTAANIHRAGRGNLHRTISGVSA
jgi:hypothetical protein